MKKLPTVLRRLGPIPFWRGEDKCLDALARLYTRAMDAAERRLRTHQPSQKGLLEPPTRSETRI